MRIGHLWFFKCVSGEYYGRQKENKHMLHSVNFNKTFIGIDSLVSPFTPSVLAVCLMQEIDFHIIPFTHKKLKCHL